MCADAGRMRPFPALLSAALLLSCAPLAAQEDCRLCSDESEIRREKPLTIEISANLDFARLALTGKRQSSASIDPVTGEKRTSGDVVNLGGMAVSGHGRITGEPLRQVRVDLPPYILMNTIEGRGATLTDFTTSLPRNPTLNAQGELEFTFGARLVMKGGRGGNYRARIPISVDYN